MTGPWAFLSLDDDAKQLRRQTLDRYAGYAQLSAFGPIFLILVYRLARWILRAVESRKTNYAAVPDSPLRKSRRRSPLGAWETRYRLAAWWLGTDVVFLGQSWGRRDEWVFGLAWGAWMGLLSVLETHGDYFHLTKRLGIIGVSQLPLQYLLALKSLNPIAYVLHSSHEQVNRFHRTLGCIIYLLLFLHACLYMNYFIKWNAVLDKLRNSRAVQTGLLGILSMTLLSGTAIKLIRTYSYRVFFITHLVVALAIPPLIWFHARGARVFVAEAMLVFVADVVARKLDTVTASATVETVAGTSLVKITAKVPPHKVARLAQMPGGHVYLQIPGPSRLEQSQLLKEYIVHDFLYNPFTVAAVNAENSTLTLLVRPQRGPTTSTLQRLATSEENKQQLQNDEQNTTRPSRNSSSSSSSITKTSLVIEGPYGVSSLYSHLTAADGQGYDRILLVAGGVGATYTIPLYRALLAENAPHAAKVEMVWAVRSAREAAWVDGLGSGGRERDSDSNAASDRYRLSADDGFHVYVTGVAADTAAARDAVMENVNEVENGSVELGPYNNNKATIDKSDEPYRYNMGTRPDFKKIVDDVFRQGTEERVAVLFCGPARMGWQLRGFVGEWVARGRVVYWHSESFEW
ncbi:ferric reductase like transmembrane component [Coniella lustricola]|uniref:Ferric reductase like transmembrane component n=1 Tax=Coniella lustricola TaxID=2025994 RepID=A0A2T3ACD4_9PEZI|nr:ferric reductase like transmembrane component [Coniella lustricola]